MREENLPIIHLAMENVDHDDPALPDHVEDQIIPMNSMPDACRS